MNEYHRLRELPHAQAARNSLAFALMGLSGDICQSYPHELLESVELVRTLGALLTIAQVRGASLVSFLAAMQATTKKVPYYEYKERSARSQAIEAWATEAMKKGSGGTHRWSRVTSSLSQMISSTPMHLKSPSHHSAVPSPSAKPHCH